jgi:hypothetical protein
MSAPKIITVLAIACLIASAGVFGFGYQMPRYHDESEYLKRYATLEGPDRSQQFYRLREEFLTESFSIQDYGVTVFLVGLILLPVGQWRKTRALLPSHKITVGALGALATYAVFKAEQFSLEMDLVRGEFPHWADSIGIPIMGLVSMMMSISVWIILWILLHAIFVPAGKRHFQRFNFSPKNWWFISMIVLHSIPLGVAIATGYFWQIIPLALWTIFYLSIWVKRSGVEAGVGPSMKSQAESDRTR